MLFALSTYIMDHHHIFSYNVMLSRYLFVEFGWIVNACILRMRKTIYQ